MLGNFSYSNPTKLYFGDNAISFLGDEWAADVRLTMPVS